MLKYNCTEGLSIKKNNQPHTPQKNRGSSYMFQLQKSVYDIKADKNVFPSDPVW